MPHLVRPLKEAYAYPMAPRSRAHPPLPRASRGHEGQYPSGLTPLQGATIATSCQTTHCDSAAFIAWGVCTMGGYNFRGVGRYGCSWASAASENLFAIAAEA